MYKLLMFQDGLFGVSDGQTVHTGSLRQVVRFAVLTLRLDRKGVFEALDDFQKLGRNWADFGVYRTLIFTDNRDIKVS